MLSNYFGENTSPAGGGGVVRDAVTRLSPIYFIFIQFSAKILPYNRLAHPFWGWRLFQNNCLSIHKR